MKVKTITCPNCGHANNFLAEECSQCGIHFSRYYEELEKAEALRRHIEEQEQAEALKREQEERERQEAEARRREEEAKAEALRREQEERERLEAEARQREEEERQRREAERRQAEEEARRLEEERRIEAQKRADILKRQKEELEKAEALKRQKEEEEKAEAERRRQEEEEKAEARRREQEEAEARQREEEEKAEALRREQEEQERQEAEARERELEEHRRQEEEQQQAIDDDTPGDAIEENQPPDDRDEIEIEELDSAAIEDQAGAFEYIEYPPENPVAGDSAEAADPPASPPNDYRPAASLQARLEFYEGRMIGLTYGNPAEIQNVKLLAVSRDHFQVFYPIPRHVVSFAYSVIVSITENAEGLSAVGPDISPVFPVVIELPRPFFHNH